MRTNLPINLIIPTLLIANHQLLATEVTIARSGIQVVLSWPEAVTNDFYLQYATNLSQQTEWRNANDPTTIGTDLVVTDDAVGSRFYRLQAWETLFDGTSTAAFRGYKQTTFPPTNVWMITTNKELMALVAPSTIRTNDLITTTQYDNFELRWEWKTVTNGISGVVIRVTEPGGANNYSDQTGPEYLLRDDANSSATGNQTMAAAFQLFAPSTNTVLLPTGEWNDCRFIVQSNHVEHWLNGGKVLEYDINSPDWVAAVENYSHGIIGPLSGFGQTSPAPIAFRHDGKQVWFRNIKVRRLSPQ